VFHNISYSIGLKVKKNKRQEDRQLSASAIGICAIPPFNIGYKSYNTIEVEIAR